MNLVKENSSELNIKIFCSQDAAYFLLDWEEEQQI